jgi:DNA-binding NarL/FixJ family response regulator
MPEQRDLVPQLADTPTRVLIIAGDPLARAGLAALLDGREEIALMGQIAADDYLLDNLDLYRPDVLVWDLGWDVDELPAELLELDLPLVALLPDEELAGAVWAAEASGLLLRETGGRRLVTAIQAVARDLRVLDPHLASAVGTRPIAEETPLEEPLTPREQEVLQLLAEGLANRAIAQELGISEHTVKFHVNAIMSKLEAQSRTAAVVRATRLGLILL